MNRHVRLQCGILGMSVIVLIAVSICTARPASASTAPASVLSIVQRVFPGATVAYNRPASGPGEDLAISLGAPLAANGTQVQERFAFERVGWLAHLASSRAALVDPSITSYSLSNPDGTTPNSARDYLHGNIRATPGSTLLGDNSNLGSLTLVQAKKQMASNLEVLQRAVGQGLIISDDVSVVSTDSPGSDFALDVNVVVPSSSVVQGHFGDVVDGLETGLVGGLSTSLIDGVAVTVMASDGTPIVGAWSTSLTGYGVLDFGLSTQAPSDMSPTVSFPVLTGGPATAASGVGRPITRSAAKEGAPPVRAASGAWWVSALVALGVAAVAAMLVLSASKGRSAATR